MSEEEDKRYLWYTRNSSGVKGPFTVGMVQRFVLIGRLQPADEVSHDKQVWTTVARTPEVIPPEMRDVRTDEDRQRLLQAQLREDERSRERRRAELSEFEGQRRKTDRRRTEDITVRVHRENRNRIQEQLHQPMKTRAPMIILFLMLATILVVAVVVSLFREEDQGRFSDCNAAAVAGVNWSHCQMEAVQMAGVQLPGSLFNNTNFAGANFRAASLARSDLSYANLGLAMLQDADLQTAILKGASLRGANLRNADLRGADLSYADLRNANISEAMIMGARLDKAIWTDGRLCASGSVGQCQ